MAANTKHTAGPWAAIPQNPRGTFWQVQSEKEAESITIGASEQNAKLIAAAPDLLAALESVLSFKYPQWETGKWDDLAPVKQARAALAKAKGIQ